MSVVVGYVPDATGFLAIVEAVREATSRDTDVVVVNVVSGGDYTTPTSAGEKDLDAVAERLKVSGVPFDIRQVQRDVERAAEEILLVAEETDAELIVVGLRRRSTMAKAILGSNAERVLAAARCPVLCVRSRSA